MVNIQIEDVKISPHEITKLIDDINDEIAHLQVVRDTATAQIHGFMDTKSKLIDTYRRENNVR